MICNPNENVFVVESITDKSKVTFHDERTTYHEVPEENTFQESQERFDDHRDEYRDDEYQDQDEAFREEDEKFEDQEQFNEQDEQYQEDSVFNEEERQPDDQLEFEPSQPKLTPKQRWHRAYNKVVMQLNVSLFLF